MRHGRPRQDVLRHAHGARGGGRHPLGLRPPELERHLLPRKKDQASQAGLGQRRPAAPDGESSSQALSTVHKTPYSVPSKNSTQPSQARPTSPLKRGHRSAKLSERETIA